MRTPESHRESLAALLDKAGDRLIDHARRVVPHLPAEVVHAVHQRGRARAVRFYLRSFAIAAGVAVVAGVSVLMLRTGNQPVSSTNNPLHTATNTTERTSPDLSPQRFVGNRDPVQSLQILDSQVNTALSAAPSSSNITTGSTFTPPPVLPYTPADAWRKPMIEP